MKEQYTAPAVELVGDAQDVVLGVIAVGTDIWGEVLIPGMQFAADQLNS